MITKSKASQIHFRIPKEVSETQCPEKNVVENRGALVEIDTIVTLLGDHVVYVLKGQNQT